MELGEATVDPNGSVTVTGRLPGSLAEGAYVLVASLEAAETPTAVREVPVTILSAAVPPSPNTPASAPAARGALAATGHDLPLAGLTIALGLLTAGAVVFRRRRALHPPR